MKINPIAVLFASALALSAGTGAAWATSPNGVDQNDVCGAEGQQDGDFKDAQCDKQDGDQNDVDDEDKNNVDDGQKDNGQTGNDDGENED
jgi:hypothetical protein